MGGRVGGCILGWRDREVGAALREEEEVREESGAESNEVCW